MARVFLWTLFMALGLSTTRALRSCTRLGQAVVPCADELVLEQRDRFLVTLFGHSCYSIHVASAHALDVYFYDTYDWTKQRNPTTPTRALRAIAPHNIRGQPVVVSNVVETMRMCHDAVDCRVIQPNRSAHTMYDLVIARSASPQAAPSSSDMRVRLRIETCDAVSKWFYIGVAVTALGGFFTMLFLLCLVSEFLLGIHAYARILRKLGIRKSAYPRRFVELAQFDRRDNDDEGHAHSFIHPTKKRSAASFALSATADPSELMSDADDDDHGEDELAQPLQRNHVGATSVLRAAES